MEQEIHIMDVQLINLQRLCDAAVSTWTKEEEECLKRLVESEAQTVSSECIFQYSWKIFRNLTSLKQRDV